MKINKSFCRDILLVIISILAVLICTFNSVGIAFGRFNKSAIYSIVCGKDSTDDSTLSFKKKIFDFGSWQLDNNNDFAHTVILSGESALNGKLRFTWDSTTVAYNDVTIISDTGLLGTGGEYTINQPNGRLEFPFSLVFSPTQRSGVAYFDVEWIPSGATKATASARYLITLNPSSIGASSSGSVSFVDNQTKFLTNDLLQFSVSVPNNVDGVMMSVGSSIRNKFNAGTFYFTKNYPQGVELLNSSILYFQKTADGKVDGIVDMGSHTSNKPINITVGTTDSSYVTTSQTPTSDTAPLVVTANKSEPILSHTSPLSFNIKEPTALRDNEWNADGSSKSELVWKIERLNNGNYEEVGFSKNFVVEAVQNKSGGEINLSAPTSDQPAGTYRLTILQNYKDYLLSEKIINFYIDYR